MKQELNNPLLENTHLTLDERGLSAVNSFLKNIADGDGGLHREGSNVGRGSTPHVPADNWEPPIDNECP